jgi:polysaccharide deacetylase 2 family uncharacterized protein YibQ
MPQSRQHRIGWSWIASLCYACGLGLLIWLNVLLLQQGVEPPVAPPPALRPDWAVDFPTRIERVTDAIAHLALPLPTPTEARQGAGAMRWMHRRYDLTLPMPEDPDAWLRQLEPIRSAAPGVTLRVTDEPTGAQVQIGIDGLLTHTLALHWLGRHPRVAIIIDDLGNDLHVARALAGIDAPLTFSVMPLRPFSKEVAELAALFGREVLLHLPMEPENGEDFGAHGMLRVGADRNEILRLLDASLATVPHAVGANNHTGSRFTADRDRMQWVLERLKEHGLFFVDSRTAPQSVACEVAATIALPCSARSLYLDDTDDEAAIRAQLDALLNQARTRGDAIAIGHPRPATVAALQAAVPGFAAAGVDVVPVSALVAGESLSRR